jgi:hypothetical protein
MGKDSLLKRLDEGQPLNPHERQALLDALIAEQKADMKADDEMQSSQDALRRRRAAEANRKLTQKQVYLAHSNLGRGRSRWSG